MSQSTVEKSNDAVRPPPRRAIVGDIEAMQHTTNIDRRQCSRVVPLKVLCLGLSRTGTASLRQALLDLGYSDVYHYAAILNENPRDAEMWNDALDAKYDPSGTHKKPFTRKDWDQLLGHCMATTDTPTVIFYRELLEAYPEAKVILTVRDSPEAWVKSYQSTIGQYALAMRPPATFWGKFVKWAFAPRDELGEGYFNRVVKWYDMIGILMRDLEKGTNEDSVKYYTSYNEEIQRLVPKERLLVMNVKEGWKPLCDFLDVAKPEWAFPQVNSTEDFGRRTAKIIDHFGGVIMWNMAKTLVPAVALAVGGLAWWMRSK
ncbi:uncharacterized protein RHO25_003616 [Cercospora beticola]|uniref:NAD dependent epimerase/dehydratase n=1 Tax=Cercospora beticola TaxID=122368 RepID=A0ABZ0NHH9_CERBT|nr:hypothetical protein RHO25_003616 [Cercospora beticola]CAK1360307.1 unnamed protein product [Cercospora beticola]